MISPRRNMSFSPTFHRLILAAALSIPGLRQLCPVIRMAVAHLSRPERCFQHRFDSGNLLVVGVIVGGMTANCLKKQE